MPGPMCASALGPGWLDTGTAALTQHRALSPQGAATNQHAPRESVGFTIAYADKEGSFAKAAKTWSTGVSKLRLFSHSFKTIDDLARIFRLLEHEASGGHLVFSAGAMFVHSSPIGGDGGGLHAAPFRPRTLAELRYKEEVMARNGLDIHTAGAAALRKLTRLPWARGARLQVFGCLSGGTPGASGSVAQVLASAQRVRTVGETGKAYFSSDPARYEPIKPEDAKIYLRAFHIKKNLAIDALEGDLAGLLSLGEVMPQRNFDPD